MDEQTPVVIPPISVDVEGPIGVSEFQDAGVKVFAFKLYARVTYKPPTVEEAGSDAKVAEVNEAVRKTAAELLTGLGDLIMSKANERGLAVAVTEPERKES